jgi:hypothetical protein
MVKKKIDKETQKILDDNKELFELTAHSGWKVARARIVTKILDLQNAFNLDDKDMQMLLIDLRARKIATTLFNDFLREIEGGAQDNIDERIAKTKSYIVSFEE